MSYKQAAAIKNLPDHRYTDVLEKAICKENQTTATLKTTGAF